MVDALGNWLNTLGPIVTNNAPWLRPEPITIKGQYCTLEPLDLNNQADELWAEMNAADPAQRQWKYLAGMGPFKNQKKWVDTWNAFSSTTDHQTFAVRVHKTGRLTGQCSLLRIRPQHGSAEVGFVRFPPKWPKHAPQPKHSFYWLITSLAPLAIDAMNGNATIKIRSAWPQQNGLVLPMKGHFEMIWSTMVETAIPLGGVLLIANGPKSKLVFKHGYPQKIFAMTDSKSDD